MKHFIIFRLERGATVIIACAVVVSATTVPEVHKDGVLKAKGMKDSKKEEMRNGTKLWRGPLGWD